MVVCLILENSAHIILCLISKWIKKMNENFARIERLPTYVFAITNELKAKARSKGEDIIDFVMGNPDQPTPKHIVDKLV